MYKKYLEDTESDALLHTVLSDPKHFKHALVTKAPSKPDGWRSKLINKESLVRNYFSMSSSSEDDYSSNHSGG